MCCLPPPTFARMGQACGIFGPSSRGFLGVHGTQIRGLQTIMPSLIWDIHVASLDHHPGSWCAWEHMPQQLGGSGLWVVPGVVGTFMLHPWTIIQAAVCSWERMAPKLGGSGLWVVLVPCLTWDIQVAFLDCHPGSRMIARGTKVGGLWIICSPISAS